MKSSLVRVRREQAKRLITSLTVAAVLFVVVSPIMAVDHPVAPFQKAKALALTEGTPDEYENSKMYLLVVNGWGIIVYIPGEERIMLTKGTPGDNSGVAYDGKTYKYAVSRVTEGGKREVKPVDWTVAMDIANKYLREIEEVREGK